MARVKIDSNGKETGALFAIASQSPGSYDVALASSPASSARVSSVNAAERVADREETLASEGRASDRRQAGRREVTVRIDYATVDEMFSEFTRDINAGGLFIETDKPHPSGTEVSMQFHLPGSPDVLRTVGRVVRVSSPSKGIPGGMGIEFDELTADDRSKIDRIVRALRAEGKL